MTIRLTPSITAPPTSAMLGAALFMQSSVSALKSPHVRLGVESKPHARSAPPTTTNTSPTTILLMSRLSQGARLWATQRPPPRARCVCDCHRPSRLRRMSYPCYVGGRLIGSPLRPCPLLFRGRSPIWLRVLALPGHFEACHSRLFWCRVALIVDDLLRGHGGDASTWRATNSLPSTSATTRNVPAFHKEASTSA